MLYLLRRSLGCTVATMRAMQLHGQLLADMQYASQINELYEKVGPDQAAPVVQPGGMPP